MHRERVRVREKKKKGCSFLCKKKGTAQRWLPISDLLQREKLKPDPSQGRARPRVDHHNGQPLSHIAPKLADALADAHDAAYRPEPCRRQRRAAPARRRTGLRFRLVDRAHQLLLAEIRRRVEAAHEDPHVTNADGSSWSGPYVTRAINRREDDGPALVQYIKYVLRKPGESQGWNALLEGDRLDISFEEMVLNADEPIRGLFDDEDREIAARSLGQQRAEIESRRDA
jgi:hypothetical protein